MVGRKSQNIAVLSAHAPVIGPHAPVDLTAEVVGRLMAPYGEMKALPVLVSPPVSSAAALIHQPRRIACQSPAASTRPATTSHNRLSTKYG